MTTTGQLTQENIRAMLDTIQQCFKQARPLILESAGMTGFTSKQDGSPVTETDVAVEKIEFQLTRKEFEGDITLVLFSFLKQIKGNPAEIGNKLGNYLIENTHEIISFNVVSGFLNLVVADGYYIPFFNSIKDNLKYGFVQPNETDKAIMVEYSSPNTNKPLHLGHVRNNLLGYAVAEIIKASGKKVYKTQITRCNYRSHCN